MLDVVLQICRTIGEAGGRAMLVGGSVRDRLFGQESKDYDLEVYYLEPARLRAILKSFGQVNTVGEHFAVYKLAIYQTTSDSLSDASAIQNPKSKIQNQRFEIDVSIPRRESKSGRGHRGFVIEGDPHMTFSEAARRRDFTINAIMQDPLTGEIVDPYGGVHDIENRLIRAVAADTFVEDSLRVLRACQMAARFEMSVAPETLALCQTIDLSDLPKERIWGEFEKLFLRAAKPSIGLQAALDLGVLDQLFPELQSLTRYRANDPASKPDVTSGDDLFALTKRLLDESVKLTGDLTKEKRVTLMLAALCGNLIHLPDGGEASIIAVLDRLAINTINNYDVRNQVLALIREADKPRAFYASSSDGDFRRLAGRVDVNMLYRFATAEALACGFESATAEAWFIEKARALDVERGAPEPLLKGRHLLEIGLRPGPQMGKIINQVYELQLDGTVTTLEEALKQARLLVDTL
jgi:tRNA nucleotidyltransferase (CCA-adding enzyme)